MKYYEKSANKDSNVRDFWLISLGTEAAIGVHFDNRQIRKGTTASKHIEILTVLNPQLSYVFNKTGLSDYVTHVYNSPQKNDAFPV